MEAAQGTSFYKMAEYQRSVADMIRNDPNVEAFMANAATATTTRCTSS